MKDIWVGTCGYQYYDPGDERQQHRESKLAAFTADFPLVELNRTFYQLPQIETAKRWRREAVQGFEFTLKAWQAITHPWNSPTWNDNRDAIPDEKTDDVGYLQPTDIVREAWEATRARAETLDASVVVLQTPPSFDCSEANKANMRELLSTIDRGDLTIAWEPRGDWAENPDQVHHLCAELDLIHIVDIMRESPDIEQEVLYTRLHGLNEDPYDYDYRYSSEELDTLANRLETYANRCEQVYCLFNNFSMYDNASSLLDRLHRRD